MTATTTEKTTEKTVYAATHMEKRVSDWDPKEGASIESRCTVHKRINLKADTLAELLDKIRTEHFVKLDDVFVGDADETDTVNYINFNQVETADCLEPDTDELAQWERGELTLYLCDYSFCLEKRIVQPITLDELRSTGISTH